MKLTYLLHELQKELNLRDQQTELFLNSVSCEPRKRAFIREQVMPVVEKDLAYQQSVVTRELERLLNDEYETNNKTS